MSDIDAPLYRMDATTLDCWPGELCHVHDPKERRRRELAEDEPKSLAWTTERPG